MKEKVNRNNKIMKARKAGLTFREIGKAFGISAPRVLFILNYNFGEKEKVDTESKQ